MVTDVLLFFWESIVTHCTADLVADVWTTVL
jgi:hypothetical protein